MFSIRWILQHFIHLIPCIVFPHQSSCFYLLDNNRLEYFYNRIHFNEHFFWPDIFIATDDAPASSGDGKAHYSYELLWIIMTLWTWHGLKAFINLPIHANTMSILHINKYSHLLTHRLTSKSSNYPDIFHVWCLGRCTRCLHYLVSIPIFVQIWCLCNEGLLVFDENSRYDGLSTNIAEHCCDMLGVSSVPIPKHE